MIIADSNAFIDFFKNPRSQLGGTVDTLIRKGRLLLVGPVLTELLRGARSDAEHRLLTSVLSGLPYAEATRSVWVRTGFLAQQLDMRGERLPLTDLVIAAHALEGDHELLTRDSGFARISGLRFYNPQRDADA